MQIEWFCNTYALVLQTTLDGHRLRWAIQSREVSLRQGQRTVKLSVAGPRDNSLIGLRRSEMIHQRPLVFGTVQLTGKFLTR